MFRRGGEFDRQNGHIRQRNPMRELALKNNTEPVKALTKFGKINQFRICLDFDTFTTGLLLECEHGMSFQTRFDINAAAWPPLHGRSVSAPLSKHVEYPTVGVLNNFDSLTYNT